MGRKNNPARSANPCPTRHTEATKSPKYPNKSSLRGRIADSPEAIQKNNPPSLAEGARGWVNHNSALNIFHKIAQIPHPSGHTKDLQKFIIDFLKQCDCKVESDSAGNIHALKGAPKIVFQAHYDMVLVGQKVAPFVENGFLKSRDSSLGADNGIAVALLLDFAQKCENFEILLTNDEEIGMLGAKNLTLQTQSKTMINLDSECLNEICVGCAGGFDADISLAEFALSTRHCENRRQPIRGNPFDFKNADIYELSAQNFKGGHSGIDIDKNIKNAVVELLWRLESLRPKCEFSILEISGGENRNSIPINAKAIIAIHRHTEPLGEVSKSRDSTNQISPDSWQSTNQNNPSLRGRIVDSPEAIQTNNTTKSRPIRGAKNRIQGRSSASADFLLESDKRGSPPKSEKAAAFWRVGRAGRGVQPFLRKEKGESNIDCHDSTANLMQIFRHTERSEVSKSRDSNKNNESITQERIGESHRFAQSKRIVGDSKVAKMDSSLRTSCYAQNDESFVDCHENSLRSFSRNDDKFLDSSLTASLKNDEWEAKSAPQITLKKLKSYTPNHAQNPLNSAVIPHLLRLHNGIYEKNGESITSSLNFSLLSNESLKIMVRANSAEFLERHKTRLKALFGDSVKISGFYNAWDSSSDSPILGALQGLYDKHKIAHKVVQIHAGLECGILKEKCALREVVSIGPTIFHPHSKNEALDLDSFGKIYDILCDLMELEI